MVSTLMFCSIDSIPTFLMYSRSTVNSWQDGSSCSVLDRLVILLYFFCKIIIFSGPPLQFFTNSNFNSNSRFYDSRPYKANCDPHPDGHVDTGHVERLRHDARHHGGHALFEVRHQDLGRHDGSVRRLHPRVDRRRCGAQQVPVQSATLVFGAKLSQSTVRWENHFFPL